MAITFRKKGKIIIILLAIVIAIIALFVVKYSDIFVEIFVPAEKLNFTILNETIEHSWTGLKKEYSFQVQYPGCYDVSFFIENDFVPWADNDSIQRAKKLPKFNVKIVYDGKDIASGNSVRAFSKNANHGGTMVMLYAPKQIPLHKTVKCYFEVEKYVYDSTVYQPPVKLIISRISRLNR